MQKHFTQELSLVWTQKQDGAAFSVCWSLERFFLTRNAVHKAFIFTSSTDAHISYSKPSGYSLHSFPRITPSSKSPEIPGGGSALMVREPAIVLNSSRHTFKSFE